MRVIKHFFYLFICFLIFFFGTCKKVPLVDNGVSIEIRNNSKDEIYFYIPSLNHQYPDTTLPITRPNLKSILPKDFFITFLKSPDSRNYFDHLASDTLSVYFFSKSTYEQEDWGNVVQQYLILKRCDVSEAKLESNEYTVTYP